MIIDLLADYVFLILFPFFMVQISEIERIGILGNLEKFLEF